MSFKPRIFISSTFDLIKLRKKLSAFFKSIGAEPLLYEENLTPSTNRSTYRKDLLNADFTIFIFDKRYGSKTDTGLSGTHEEWLISNQNNIPSHVYIKFESEEDENSKEEKLKEFISEEIDSNFVSYYFFRDEKDLLKRLKETSLTIAHDIVLSNIEQSRLEKRVVRNLSINQDYKEALSFIRHMEEVIHLHHIDGGPGLTRTTVLNFILGSWASYSDQQRSLFIDEKLNDLFHNIFIPYKEITAYQLKALSAGQTRKIYLKSMGMEISYEYLVPLSSSVTVDWDLLRGQIKKLIEEYQKFKEEVMRQKNQNDIHFNY